MEQCPLTDYEAFMRGRLLLCLEESKAHVAASGVTTREHYIWAYTHQLQLDELDAFDRGEGIWWGYCQPRRVAPDEPDAAS